MTATNPPPPAPVQIPPAAAPKRMGAFKKFLIVAAGTLTAIIIAGIGCTALVVGGTAAVIDEIDDNMEAATVNNTVPANPNGDDICWVDGRDILGDLTYAVSVTNTDAAGSIQLDLVFRDANGTRIGDEFHYVPSVRAGELLIESEQISWITYEDDVTCEIFDTSYWAD